MDAREIIALIKRAIYAPMRDELCNLGFESMTVGEIDIVMDAAANAISPLLATRDKALADAQAEIARLRAALEPNTGAIEAAVACMYGSGWFGPAEKQPGEKMKDVWRQHAKRALEGAYDAALSSTETGTGETRG